MAPDLMAFFNPSKTSRDEKNDANVGRALLGHELKLKRLGMLLHQRTVDR